MTKRGGRSRTVAVGTGLPLLQKGSHSVAVDARFAGDGPVIKGTVKLMGTVEAIKR